MNKVVRVCLELAFGAAVAIVGGGSTALYASCDLDCVCEPPEENAGNCVDCQSATCGDWVCEDAELYGGCPCTDCCPEGCCVIDTCLTCTRPAAGQDHDNDGVPDTLEYDLAYKFFPHILLQHTVADLKEAYVARGLSIPYVVQPVVSGVCDEDTECIEIRYGTAYLNDCGDNAEDDCSGIGGHDGDSENYAALLMRTTDWAAAQDDPERWNLIRDMASAHGGEHYKSYGICTESFCAQYHGNSNCIAEPACALDITSGECYSRAPCGSPSTQLEALTKYSSEGKHALYHSDAACDAGGFLGADDCPNNQFDMADYIDGRLQNVGTETYSIDSLIRNPVQCNDYDVWADNPFGTASSYYSKFAPAMYWKLPPSEPCRSVLQLGSSFYTAPDCGGDEFYASGTAGTAGAALSWDGLGCAGHWTLTETVYSYRDTNGVCRNDWPTGTLRSDLVTVSRAGLPPPTNCAGCAEEICEAVASSYSSLYRQDDCAGFERYEIFAGGSPESWDGGGCAGTVLTGLTSRSYKDDDGYCHNTAGIATDTGRVYRTSPQNETCTACGEASCRSVNATGDSYFTGAECSGTEYAAPSGSANRISWEGSGCSGNLLGQPTVLTKRDSQGFCWSASGSTGDKVSIYRSQQPSLPTCAGCGERSCTSVTGSGFSYFAGADCDGTEYFRITVGSATRRSWDSNGCAGDLGQGSIFIRSYKDSSGVCHDELQNQFMGLLSKIYRGNAPAPGCKKCPKPKDGN